MAPPPYRFPVLNLAPNTRNGYDYDQPNALTEVKLEKWEGMTKDEETEFDSLYELIGAYNQRSVTPPTYFKFLQSSFTEEVQPPAFKQPFHQSYYSRFVTNKKEWDAGNTSTKIMKIHLSSFQPSTVSSDERDDYHHISRFLVDREREYAKSTASLTEIHELVKTVIAMDHEINAAK